MDLVPNPPLPEQFPAALPTSQSSKEDPPFTGWDVVLMAVVFFAVVNVLLALALAIAVRLHVDGVTAKQLAGGREALKTLLGDARVILPPQLAGYSILLALMIAIVRARAQDRFLEAVRWRWPSRSWPAFVCAGMLLALAVSLTSAFLPIPRSLPMDQLFKDPTSAYVTSVFGIFAAPFMEELFFRGFMYPVLARRIGIFLAIVFTTFAFALMHAAQLGYSWAPLLMLFIVSLVLTATRAKTGSLASAVLLHMGYNTTLFAFVYFSTAGFRHLERG